MWHFSSLRSTEESLQDSFFVTDPLIWQEKHQEPGGSGRRMGPGDREGDIFTPGSPRVQDGHPSGLLRGWAALGCGAPVHGRAILHTGQRAHHMFAGAERDLRLRPVLLVRLGQDRVLQQLHDIQEKPFGIDS